MQLINKSITGRLNERVYPNRHKIMNLRKKYKDIYYFKPNIGYRIKKSEKSDNHIYGKKFLELLNKFYCGFTCDLIKERPFKEVSKIKFTKRSPLHHE